MPGIGDTSFLPLESLGGNKFYAKSGVMNTLPELTGEGMQYGHASAALTLPMISLFVTAGAAVSGTGEVVLPRLTTAGQTGAAGRVKLPALGVGGTLNIANVGRADLALPMLVTDGHALVGEVYSGALTLPRLTVAMRVGGRGAAVLPAIAVGGSATFWGRGTFAGTLPALRVSGSVVPYSYPARGAVLLPALVAGPYGRGALLLPSLFTTGGFVLPAEYEAWVMNVRNGAVTRFTNYPFTTFARVGGVTYGVANGALYRLGGDLDDTAPIAWEFETGLEDLGSPALKHIPYVYLDGIIDGVVEIVLLDDRGREFAYEYDTKDRGAVHQPHRRKLGNGIRTRNVAFRLRSPEGAYLELDSLEPEATLTQRSL